jgi:hypothetical protein
VNGKSTFQTMRMIFVAGCVINTVMTFVPVVEIKNNPNLPDGSYSSFDVTRLLLEAAPPFGMFFVLLFSLNIVLAVLAFTYPRRWVFILGASYAALGVLYGIFSGSRGDTEVFLIPQVVGWIATLALLSGFFVKPEPQRIAVKVKV